MLAVKSQSNEMQNINDAFKQPVTYFILCSMWLGVTYGMAVSANFKAYGAEYHDSDEFLT